MVDDEWGRIKRAWAAVKSNEPPREGITELDKEQWWEVCKNLRRYSREEFDEAWEEFQVLKAKRSERGE